MEKKLIAISTNGSNAIALVKSVNEQEYKKLINLQEQNLAKGEKSAREHEQQHNDLKKSVEHFELLTLVLAKSVYDNFVDRGLIENDNDFQQKWFDFYFNDKELDLDATPSEYEKIVKKLGELHNEESI